MMHNQSPPSMRSVYRSTEGRLAVRAWCTERLDHWTVPHQRSSLTTSAGTTHVVRTGTAPPAVVVVPGTNSNAAVLESLAVALAPRWPTLLLDLPGQPGLSSGERPSRHRSAWYARWLADVLAQTVTEPVIVLGHSLGGGIMLACNSSQIGGRLLVSTAGLARPKVSPGIIAATLPWLARPTQAHSAALIRRLLAPGRIPPPSLIDWYTLIARHTRTTFAPPVLPAALLSGRRDVPRVVATGEHDAFLPPARLRRPAARRLNTPLRVIPDSGHLVTDEHPERLVELVAELLR